MLLDETLNTVRTPERLCRPEKSVHGKGREGVGGLREQYVTLIGPTKRLSLCTFLRMGHRAYSCCDRNSCPPTFAAHQPDCDLNTTHLNRPSLAYMIPIG
jgi:hypothetical protein